MSAIPARLALVAALLGAGCTIPVIDTSLDTPGPRVSPRPTAASPTPRASNRPSPEPGGPSPEPEPTASPFEDAPLPVVPPSPPHAGGGLAASDLPFFPPSQQGASYYQHGLAVDGDGSTRWSSRFTDDEWFQVDLGEKVAIDRVKLTWTVYGQVYRVEVSDDAKNWSSVMEVSDGHGGTEEWTFDATPARYVRMHGSKRGTGYGYSLVEFEVYGPDAPSANLARGKATSASSVEGATTEPDAVMKALDGIDPTYKAGRYDEAFEAYKKLWDDHADILANRDNAVYEQLRLRLLSADYRRAHPNDQGEQQRVYTMFVIPESEMDVPTGKDDPTPVHVHQFIDDKNVAQSEAAFFWFSESFLALTQGRVHWTIKTVRFDGTKVVSLPRNTFGSDGIFLAQPNPDNVEPSIQDRLEQFPETDMFCLKWPGVGDPAKGFINGGSGSWTIHVNGKEQKRAMFIADDLYTTFFNSAPWYHHEFFHQVESAYAELDWPKSPMHVWFDRTKWPTDYVGTGEWDFFENTYRKRVLPKDGLDRMRWAMP